MTRKLYIYDHCPFCTKAHMIFGLKGIPVEPVILLNDDEAGPIGMIGRKMVPILEEDGRFMGESMDIVAHVDAIGAPVLTGPTHPALAAWLRESNGPVYRAFLPRAAAAPLPEFATTGARAYFIRNKEAATGPFHEAFAETPALVARIDALLEKLAPMIAAPDAVNGVLSTDDIHLFAQLRSLSLIRGITYPDRVEAYRHAMARRAGMDLFDSIAA
jgi:glutaredoxin 2